MSSSSGRWRPSSFDLIRRDLPEQVSEYTGLTCPEHPEQKLKRLARARLICPQCVRQQARPQSTGSPDTAP